MKTPPIPFDQSYLQRIDALEAGEEQLLLLEPQFLQAQDLLFAAAKDLGGSFDFDIADMRETHIAAALENHVKGKKILDIGCGSTEKYVLEDTFRDRYPPLMAHMLATLGAKVTGIDIRPNPTAKYDHRVADLSQSSWIETIDPPYEIVLCLSLFNAPESPFEHNQLLCKKLMQEIASTVKPEGLLIATLPEELFPEQQSMEVWTKNAQSFLDESNLTLLHCGRSMVWATKDQ